MWDTPPVLWKSANQKPTLFQEFEDFPSAGILTGFSHTVAPLGIPREGALYLFTPHAACSMLMYLF